MPDRTTPDREITSNTAPENNLDGEQAELKVQKHAIEKRLADIAAHQMTLALAHASPETRRLLEDDERKKNWKRWGPYLSERQWATVREDYSPYGDCWSYFPHDHARSRAYRWGEDGLLGICDRECRLCFGLALWNGKDPILKERLFGLTGSEGNHGEDVKEEYFYLDSTPTHSYMKGLYKYPQSEYPYGWLVEENRRRGRFDPEFELVDTGVFRENRYWDIQAEYAKGGPDDILIRITVSNRGPDPAELHLLPTLWFRNTWIWECSHEGCLERPPSIKAAAGGDNAVIAEGSSLGPFRFEADSGQGIGPERWLFTNNETNAKRLWGISNPFDEQYVKDAFHEVIVHGNEEAANPKRTGTKAAPVYRLAVAPGESRTVRLRLFAASAKPAESFGNSFDKVFADRLAEADRFYFEKTPPSLDVEQKRVMRQALSGMLWSKQFFHYVVSDWIKGDKHSSEPPSQRQWGRNWEWKHVFCRDVLSMPDKWEYPWFASWDLAFHTIPLSMVDPQFAKDQLLLLLREWYMHPNGQLPAYEFAFGDVNPPVHAWACWRVYKIAGNRQAGGRDRLFLERAFQKLMINFTWWVNRKDVEGHNIFAGGFLGLDNIGIFDRSKPLPGGGHLNQADGTAWMAFFCAIMLSMALELASYDEVYEDIASKFFEHFVAITDAINSLGGAGLWDEQDGFYYDQFRREGGDAIPLRVRTMVGIIPLFTCEILREIQYGKLKGFQKRMKWFMDNRPELAKYIAHEPAPPAGSGALKGGERYLLAIPSKERLVRVLRYVLDENEFLSPYGVRSLSRAYKDHPYVLELDGQRYDAGYTPAESNTSLFGGNSNWRGPIWFPLNFLLIDALERYNHFYGDGLQVEHPTGSGNMMNLADVAIDLESRLSKLFLPDAAGNRPCNGGDPRFQDPHWRDLVLFHEYFDGDNGRGVGANHQTGWTGLIGRIMRDIGRRVGPAPEAYERTVKRLRPGTSVPVDEPVAAKA
jgi:hypothetical protein